MGEALKTKPAKPAIKLTKLFIGNEWCDPIDGGSFQTLDPSTGAPIADVAEAGPKDIDHAVATARRALDDGPWGRMDAPDRGRLMLKLADLVEANADELATLEAYNSGKTLTDAQADMQGVANTLRYYGGWADKIEGRVVPTRGPTLSYTLRQPVGVVGQIIPWNFPLLMLAWKWGPALACGNAIVMKLAEQTPLTGLRMAELAMQAGFPPGVINVLNGMGETTGDAMVKHPGIDKIAFTGHVDTAKIIARNAAQTLKRVTFELGGKSPNVIFADAPIEEAVAGAFFSIYFNCGQCCTAGSRLFVERKIHGEFVERMVEQAKKRRLGDPLDPRTEQGPQVSQEQLDKVLSYIELGQKEGAKLVAGGARRGDSGFYVEPTILDNARDDMKVVREEIFGPVVSVLPFDGVEEVIKRSNDTNYGLAAAIWTKDIDKAHTFAKKVKAGTVWVNCYHIVDTCTPFGGFKQSGQGRENGEAALEHYTETKTVTIKLS